MHIYIYIYISYHHKHMAHYITYYVSGADAARDTRPEQPHTHRASNLGASVHLCSVWAELHK